MLSIEFIMTPNPHTLKANHTIAEAFALMEQKHIRHIPVVDDNEKLVGIVSQRNLLAHYNDLDKTLDQVLTSDVVTITLEHNVRHAALMMEKHKIGCLPVIKAQKVVGIITDSDYLAVAINLLEQIELDDPSEL